MISGKQRLDLPFSGKDCINDTQIKKTGYFFRSAEAVHITQQVRLIFTSKYTAASQAYISFYTTVHPILPIYVRYVAPSLTSLKNKNILITQIVN